MEGLFVKDTDETVVKIYIARGTKDGTLYVDIEKGKLETLYDDVDVNAIEEHEVIFKKLSFGDKTEILSGLSSLNGNANGEMSLKLDVLAVRAKAMAVLLKRWTFKDENGNPIPATKEELRRLDPYVAEMISMKFNEINGDIV